MSARTPLTDAARTFRRILHLMARPVRRAGGAGDVVLQPYRGYGSPDEVFLIGRAFRQPPFRSSARGTVRRDLIDLARRVLRRGIADATLIAHFCGAEQRVSTDRDGYFRVRMCPAERPPPEHLWHRMLLVMVSPAEAKAEAQLFVPPSACRYVVISDIDDTVMYTGVANKLKMLWRLFMRSAQSRVAFPGMAAFLRAMHRGVSGAELNPMLYVSRGPWSIYDVLDEFFNLHDIPVGPVLFLREWGITLQSPLPRRAEGHKLELIRNMLSLYRELPFVLIGDSGQHDPEIYAQIVREHPSRVLAIYIRNVSRDAARRREIEALAVEVVDAGSSLLLAADSMAMARHAAEHGLIAPRALGEVLGEKQVQQDEPDVRPTLEVERLTPAETRQAVQRGKLEHALEEGDEAESPPNVVVESNDGTSAPGQQRESARRVQS